MSNLIFLSKILKYQTFGRRAITLAEDSLVSVCLSLVLIKPLDPDPNGTGTGCEPGSMSLLMNADPKHWSR